MDGPITRAKSKKFQEEPGERLNTLMEAKGSYRDIQGNDKI